MRSVLSASVVALSAAWPAAAQEAGGAPVTEVTLSSGGLAEIVRRAEVSGDAELVIDVPSDQIDDVLKSLLVTDPSGTVSGAALPGPDGTAAAFRTLPFTPEDLASPARLFGSLPGAEVTASRGGSVYAGRILGVSDQAAGEGRVESLLSLATASGVVSVPLGEGTEVMLSDQALSARIQEAMDILASSRREGTLALAIGLRGKGDREVFIRYVVPTPVWKTAHRLILSEDGEARMQSWAVIENFSGADWDGVRMSLTSGEPVTLRQSLHAAHWAGRTEVPVAEKRRREADLATLAQQAMAAEPYPAAAPPPAPAPVSGIAGAPAEAELSEGAASVTYTVPWPVDLAEGRSLTLPVIDRRMESERLSVFGRGGGSLHPVASVRISNSDASTLAPGILTLYDGRSGYSGDAMLAAVAPGEEVTVPFAEDRKVTVRTGDMPEERIVSVRISDGMLHARRLHRHTVSYSAEGAPDESRTLLIEHRRRPGWRAEITGGTEDAESDADVLRIRASLPAGETAEVRVAEEYAAEEAYAFADMDAEFILHVAGTTGLDPDLTSRLREIAAVRSEQRRAARDLDRAETETERIAAEQSRIRDNLGSVPENSDLGQRYLSALSESEDRILAAEEVAAAARERMEALAGELEKAVSRF